MKLEILEELGEAALLFPEQLNRALAANDRLKYLLTLLQAAASHADAPGSAPPELSTERLVAGLSDPGLDRIPAQARREGDDYLIPRAEELYARMREALEEMLLPLRTAADAGAEPKVAELELRVAQVAPPDAVTSEIVRASWLAQSTRADRSSGDSLHVLVMDMHRELNRLQAAIASESVDGCAVYGVRDEDRPRIAAFMRGLQQTAPLKFDHPGLDTTATRAGDTLVIQNDIGTTDAHVLVLRVEGLVATVTYTDVHSERAEFFRELFEGFVVQWSRAARRTPGWDAEDDSYVLLTGSYAAENFDDLDRFLSRVGSRIVFLIDWNRARRALRRFVRNRDARALLRWAADADLGHRALIQLGGAQLVADAIDQSTPEPLPYGKRLDEVLGRDTAVECLRTVLRLTSTGLREGRSERLIRDQVRNELARRFRSLDERMLDLAAKHVMVVADLAGAARSGVLHALMEGDAEYLRGVARRAHAWEQQADALVIAARTTEPPAAGRPFYGPLLSTQDDVADYLEDVVFLSTLLPSVDASDRTIDALRSVADLLVRGARALVRCVVTAQAAKRDDADEDVREFLEAVDEVVNVEHEADEVERSLVALLVSEAAGFQQQYLLDRLAAAMEDSVDAMAHSAFALRDHLVGSEWPPRR